MADEAELSSLTFAEIKKLKVTELKVRLSSLGLPVSGLKADLVARLASYLESRALQAALTAKNEEDSMTTDVPSTFEFAQEEVAKGDVILIESDNEEEFQPNEPSGHSDVPHAPEPISIDVVPDITTNVSKIEHDISVATTGGENTVMAEPSVETVGDTIGSPTGVTQVEQMAFGENIDAMQDEQQESKIAKDIQEEKGIEIRPDEGVDSHPEEVGVEETGVEQKTEAPSEQIQVMESESITQEGDEANIPENQGETSQDVDGEISRSVEVEQDTDQDAEILPRLVEPHAGEDELLSVTADSTQQPVPSDIYHATIEELSRPDQSNAEDMDMEIRKENESVVPIQDETQSSVVQELVDDEFHGQFKEQQQLSHIRSQEPSELSDEIVPPEPHPPPQIPTYLEPQTSTEEIEHIPLERETTLPRDVPPYHSNDMPQDDVPTSDIPQRDSIADTPQEDKSQWGPLPTDIPPEDAFPNSIPSTLQDPRHQVPSPPAPSDAISEAIKKARSVVEMRERRMNEEGQAGIRGDDSGYDVDNEQESIPAVPESKQERKKKKKKRKKKRNNEQPQFLGEAQADDEGIEVEYVTEALDVKDPVYAQFAQIFETFKLTEKPEATKKEEAKDKPQDKPEDSAKKDDDEMDTDSEEEEAPKKDEETGEKGVEKLSKKKLKLKNRMSVAELKQTVHRPDVVEMHDVTAPDPKLLVYLKACRNTVPVPRHWCFKRKFLQGKRGIIKPPFQLPEFIQKTGIMEMREALQEKEEAKNMKAKMREKIRPKMGKIDIDYQKLHDAFFKWQTKPKMSIHGDLYYEGKEFETKLKEKKPGDLSEDLRTALGMPTGQGSHLVPPPWLIAMQRYGPPPSYPNLKIPGLNAPIPEGASFGYHAGGWGKPPVDEHGRPLYGDVFGMQQTDMNMGDDELVDSNLWGELESESEESEESEEESEEEAPDQSGLVTPAETGLVTPSGLTSIPAGMETPDMIELRKRKNIEDAMESGSEQPTLYTVLPEKRAGVGGMMMGTSHVYDLATAAPTGTRKTPGGLSEGVEVTLDPSELELDPAAMQARYDEQLREQQNTQKEDFSDMVAEHAARQQKKRKKTAESGKAAKKYKEFKF